MLRKMDFCKNDNRCKFDNAIEKLLTSGVIDKEEVLEERGIKVDEVLERIKNRRNFKCWN